MATELECDNNYSFKRIQLFISEIIPLPQCEFQVELLIFYPYFSKDISEKWPVIGLW